MNISKKWTSGVEEPEELEAKLKEQKRLFLRLYELIEIKEDVNYRNRINSRTYDNPTWALKQADSTGYARALDELKILLNFTQE